MKVAKSTQQRIAIIKAEAIESRRHLENLLSRLQEHAGTKRISGKLKIVIAKLDEWQKAA